MGEAAVEGTKPYRAIGDCRDGQDVVIRQVVGGGILFIRAVCPPLYRTPRGAGSQIALLIENQALHVVAVGIGRPRGWRWGYGRLGQLCRCHRVRWARLV